MVFLLSLVLFTQISVYTFCDIGTVHLVSHEYSKNYIIEANLTVQLKSTVSAKIVKLFLSLHQLSSKPSETRCEPLDFLNFGGMMLHILIYRTADPKSL